MSEFKKRSSSKASSPENSALDAFSESNWNAEDFELAISSSLNQNLNDSTDLQWNEMLDSFNGEEFEDDFDSDSDSADGMNSNSDSEQNYRDSGNDFNDDFNDDFKDDFKDDFDDDFSDGFTGDTEQAQDDRSGSSSSEGLDSGNNPTDTAAKKKGEVLSGKSVFIRLLILIAAVLTGLGVLIKISVDNTSSDKESQERNSDEMVFQESSDDQDLSEMSSEDVLVVSSEASVSSEQTEETHNYKQLKKGDRNENVLKMQNRLCELGYLSDTSCTGYYGDYTVKKVKQFQKAAGLSETGKADPVTLERLYSKDAPKA